MRMPGFPSWLDGRPEDPSILGKAGSDAEQQPLFMVQQVENAIARLAATQHGVITRATPCTVAAQRGALWESVACKAEGDQGIVVGQTAPLWYDSGSGRLC